MMTPFDVWAPMFRAPFSGDVTQEIVPRFLSPEIKGIPEIEQKVLTEVASYGSQLSKILDALQILADHTGKPLPDIDALVKDIDAIKEDSIEEIRGAAETALDRLRKADQDAYQKMLKAR